MIISHFLDKPFKYGLCLFKKYIYFVKNNYKVVMMWNMLIIIIIIVKMYTFLNKPIKQYGINNNVINVTVLQKL